MTSSKPRRHHNGPVRLDRLAQDCLAPAVSRQGFGTAEILTAWPDIVGAELAERARPERIRWPRRRPAEDEGGGGAKLVVRAEGGDALELQHRKDEILARVNAFLGWGAVERLVIRQVPVAPVPGAAAQEVAAADAGDTEPELGRIAEPELRAALARLARAGRGGNNST